MNTVLQRPWRDISSFAQSDLDRTPRTWRARFGKFDLTITRHRDYPPDQWVASCFGVFDHKVMKSQDVWDAAEEAKTTLRDILEECLQAINDDA